MDARVGLTPLSKDERRAAIIRAIDVLTAAVADDSTVEGVILNSADGEVIYLPASILNGRC